MNLYHPLAISIPTKFYKTGAPGIYTTFCQAREEAGDYSCISLGELITTLLPNVLVVAGVIFFLLILGGGFALVVGAGGEGNAQSAAKAKAAVTYGVVGFLLVVGAYFILQMVGVLTGVNFINPTSLN